MTSPTTATSDDYRWLESEEARRWIGWAGGRDLVTATGKLRKQLSPQRVSLILKQAELRPKAAAKFSRAEQMVFTEVGLQQSTAEAIARYKAARFAKEPIADLCCGLGGDAIGLASRGPVVAVDRDEKMLACARVNCRTYGLDRVEFISGPAEEFDVSAVRAWHLDPDRRASGGRTTTAEFFSPPSEQIERLLAENPHAAVKLAPATVAPAEWQSRAELEWISWRRECRQQVAWFGALAPAAGIHRATLLSADGDVRSSFSGEPGETAEITHEVQRLVYDPDPALAASQLVGAFSRRNGLWSLDTATGYLTAMRTIDDPLATAFEVRDVLPLNVKKLKSYVRQHHIGRLELKKRASDIDLKQLRKELTLQGDQAATLLITRIGRRNVAIVAARLGPP